MTREEAIKYLRQLYPNGGHCWLDEQRIEAIGIAVKSLQEEPVSEDLIEATNNYCVNVRKGYPRVMDETDRYICNAFKAGSKWQKEHLLKDAVEREVKEDAGGYPYIDETELYDYDNDKPLAKAGDKIKVLIVKDK